MSMAEFDQYADAYREQHAANISVSGEEPAFFGEYKIRDLRRLSENNNVLPKRILDFGAGIGNSIPYFREFFPDIELTCGDVSRRSLATAAERFPGDEIPLLIQEDQLLDRPDDYFDICFAACAFHHIPHEQHSFWLRELRRVVRSGGLLVIFEHNPLNPLTVHAVNTCPFDANAHLISARALGRSVSGAGWTPPRCEYRIFFPRFLSIFRGLEKFMTRLPLGAQYSLTSRKIS